MTQKLSLAGRNAPQLLAFVLFSGLTLAGCGLADMFPTASGAPVTESGLPAQRVTVSGISSGAYMAVQAQVALSDHITGVAVVAGGPYHCAQGSIGKALGPCLSGKDLDLASLTRFTRQASESRQIANADSLGNARVWVFNSPKDAVVSQDVGRALVDFYAAFTSRENLHYVSDIETAHGWPTQNEGRDCLDMGGDFINRCDYDAAGELLNFLVDNLTPPPAGESAGRLTDINLSAYFEGGSSVADTGFVFVPDACVESAGTCRLHIAFHGCRQGAQFIQNRFALGSGLNRWAAANRIVVLYPQVESSAVNPQGCWDWWGYTGTDYDLASGKQVSGVGAVIRAFAENRLLPHEVQ
ncbi:MAG: PHB depolymerase family esterase [Gammaproteobacteria bacterium]|nr:PHB depolymerase family esterase [Gammaproteobacteria bacterium]